MVNFYQGVAGRRQGAIKGVVIHDDAGSINATPDFYRKWLPTHNAENGFAHVYISAKDRFQAESYDNKAWHTANVDGNSNYIGWEVCQSMADVGTYRANQQAAIRDVAKFMKERGMTPNSSTVKLHKEFSSTSCPHRASELAGGGVEATRNFYINEIRKAMQGVSSPNVNKIENIEMGEIGMFIYFNDKDMYGVWGNARFHLNNTQKVEHFKAIVKNFTGKDCKEYKWTKGSEQIKTVESFTTLQPTIK